MDKVLKVNFDDLVFKKFSSLPKTVETDLDGVVFSDEDYCNKKANTNNYYVIIYEKKINDKIFKLISSKLYFDLDYLKIKIYMNGSIEIRHNYNFSLYSYNFDFLYY